MTFQPSNNKISGRQHFKLKFRNYTSFKFVANIWKPKQLPLNFYPNLH